MAMRYPSQYEAQLVLDTNEALNNIYKGGAHDCNTARYITNWQRELQSEFNKIFDDEYCSPWKIVMKRGKRKIEWRKGWTAEGK